ncbi:MAG: sulfatase/phosphatase domain-containing protein, partial [Planctomycetota bacterium]
KSAYAQKNSSLFEEGEVLRGEDLVRWKYQRFIDDYLSCAAGVDDSVGKVLDYLDQAGLAENTLVVYCSDQGFFLGEHGWFDKRFMYEQSLRTPLVMRWPGVITPSRVENRIVSNVDFAQTFLAMAGAKAGEDMQGRSLMPLLTDEPTPDWRRSFYYHYYEGRDGGHNVCEHEGVTDGRFKLIHFYKLGEWELFDLETDPLEMRSCYGEPGYADTQRRLEEELDRLRLELAVPDEP